MATAVFIDNLTLGVGAVLVWLIVLSAWLHFRLVCQQRVEVPQVDLGFSSPLAIPLPTNDELLRSRWVKPLVRKLRIRAGPGFLNGVGGIRQLRSFIRLLTAIHSNRFPSELGRRGYVAGSFSRKTRFVVLIEVAIIYDVAVGSCLLQRSLNFHSTEDLVQSLLANQPRDRRFSWSAWPLT